jgi:hypothetical protein
MKQNQDSEVEKKRMVAAYQRQLQLVNRPPSCLRTITCTHRQVVVERLVITAIVVKINCN